MRLMRQRHGLAVGGPLDGQEFGAQINWAGVIPGNSTGRYVWFGRWVWSTELQGWAVYGPSDGQMLTKAHDWDGLIAGDDTGRYRWEVRRGVGIWRWHWEKPQYVYATPGPIGP